MCSDLSSDYNFFTLSLVGDYLLTEIIFQDANEESKSVTKASAMKGRISISYCFVYLTD